MSKLIDMGKENVKSGYLKGQFNEINDTFFEILGATKSEYYGRVSIEDIKKRYDKEDEIFKLKFYKYVNLELQECNFGEACNTLECKQHNIFIFSEEPEYERLFYVMQVI